MDPPIESLPLGLSTDFDTSQLAALAVAVALVTYWARADRRAQPWRRPAAGLLATSAAGVAIYLLATKRSEDGFLLAVVLAPLQLLVVVAAFFRDPSSRGSHVSKRRLVAGNLLVLALLLATLLAIAELWFRFARDTTDSIGYSKTARRWLERHYALNNLGYRDDVDYALRRDHRTHRVTFVGDSFAAGHGIANVADRFAHRLRRREPDWEIHVMAKNGGNTASELEELAVAIRHGYEVDEVVLVYCLNDLEDLVPPGPSARWRSIPPPAERLAVFDNSYFLDALYYDLVVARLPGMGDYFSSIGEAYEGDIWTTHRRRLRRLRALVEAAGGRLSVVTWPFVHALGPEYPYLEIHDGLATFWNEEGVMHLDLLTAVRGHSGSALVVNANDAHPNERANELAADAIQSWLRGVLATPR